MEITPSQIIGFRNSQRNGPVFHGYNPATGNPLNIPFQEATAEEINESVELAQNAFKTYRKTSPTRRIQFLEAIAANIEALGDDLLYTINEETALPLARLIAERSRTTGQINLFARLLQDGKWNTEIIDEALPDRKPAPRPELIQIQKPIGPIAVFGASNFPLAFSVAGGDTVSALAAGCPVIFKAHPAHPATCQLVGRAITNAAKETAMPEGVFSMLHGLSNETGSMLISHPFIKAIAFTGSFKGGKAIFDLAMRRKEPIPVYAEMGSVNPVFFLPHAVRLGGETLVSQFAQSVTMGSGQFCTNPGICVFINNEESKSFIQKLAATMSATPIQPLLTRGIAEAYKSGLDKQKKLYGAHTVVRKSGNGIRPSVISVSVKDVLNNRDYFEEVFGPSTVAVLAEDLEEMRQIIEAMPGQLTGTVHAAERDHEAAKELIDLLTQKVGRVVMGGFPTGVEVCHAMVHGGPYPATTDSRVTSVGTGSIYRFTRPVCYQNIPSAMLEI